MKPLEGCYIADIFLDINCHYGVKNQAFHISLFTLSETQQVKYQRNICHFRRVILGTIEKNQQRKPFKKRAEIG
jgi:hypothetical protein